MSYTARKAYTDKRTASEYDKRRFKSLRGRLVDSLEKKRIVDGLALLLGEPKNQTLLDAPAGTGRMSADLLQRGYRVVAIDISQEMLRQAEEIHGLGEAPGFLGYVCADLEHLPFAEGAFDAVVSLRVMGHLPLDVKRHALEEYRRVGRAGAVIMFIMDSVLLRLKRWVLYVTGLKRKPPMWFPVSRKQARGLVSANRWGIVMARDVIQWITESRVYVLRALGVSVTRAQ